MCPDLSSAGHTTASERKKTVALGIVTPARSETSGEAEGGKCNANSPAPGLGDENSGPVGLKEF